MTRYSAVRWCNIRTQQSTAREYLIFLPWADKGIGGVEWIGFRKIQTVKISLIKLRACCFPRFPNSALISVLLNKPRIMVE